MNNPNIHLCIISDVTERSGAGKAIAKINSFFLSSPFITSTLISSKSIRFPCNMYRNLLAKIDALIRKVFIRRLDKYFSLSSYGFFNIHAHSKKLSYAHYSSKIYLIGWSHRSFMDFRSLQKVSDIPIIIRLSDEWFFTGGCHFIGDCKQIYTNCASCPEARFRLFKNFSKSLKLKTQLLDKRNVHIVFPSKNLMAKHSKINQYNKINFHYIPTSVDCSIFSRDQSLHKEVLERDENIIYFSFTAADPYNDARKNLAFAVDLVSELNKKFIAKYSINLIIVGGDPNSSATAYNESFITKIAYTNDTSTLRQIYSNSSLHLTTSLADNLPNTTLEALACGCPLASYNCGGLSEVTVDEYNGYLFNSLSMIEWVSRLSDYVTNHRKLYSSFVQNSTDLANSKFSENIIKNEWLKLVTFLA